MGGVGTSCGNAHYRASLVRLMAVIHVFLHKSGAKILKDTFLTSRRNFIRDNIEYVSAT